MDVNIIQALLVFIVAFIMGIDQFSFLESLYQPIVLGPIIGAILGNFELGITLKDLSFQFSWVMAGLDAAGGAMKFVGFAILMKVMMSGEMWGFLRAGFAMSVICSNISAISGATLLLCAFVGIAIALYDYQVNMKIKNNAGSNVGGVSDGI